ncbi:MAG: DNA recombination protein RmuC [Lacisediminimonas sp.]|nr:DNA recombination protein RmuC [Lacisediminimonas sp.]
METIWLGVGGMALGLLVGWIAAKARSGAAFEKIRSELAVGLATATERIRTTDIEREQLREELRSLSAELKQHLADSEKQLDALRSDASAYRETAGRAETQLEAERLAMEKTAAELTIARDKVEALTRESRNLQARVAELSTSLDLERESAADKLLLLQEAKEALSNQFKSLANDILDEKSKHFAEQNKVHHASLGQILDPLRTKLHEFQGKVEQVYVQEGKDRTALAEQVKQLMELNQSLSQDAKNLTQALKGSNKTQGNWGELVLERVLESSGLRKGEEYLVQDSRSREDGSRGQPDVVIRLPEDRHLVVDAKMSLIAYEQFVLADTDSERASATKRHLDSVRAHIRGLSEKNYQKLYELQSLDFVLMFVPLEPAFMLAVTGDDQLFMDAWKKNVLLVSPSTLLFVVRTVAHLWRQESQSKNAQDIAHRGAELYDKLVGFVQDLETLGNRLKMAQQSYDSAHNKLASGRGNVIRQAEMLRELGVKPTKQLPPVLVDAATLEPLVLPPHSDISQSAKRLATLGATMPEMQEIPRSREDAQR